MQHHTSVAAYRDHAADTPLIEQHLRREAAKVCGDISPGQVGSRRIALDIAAEAGVHGAATAAMSEGLDDHNHEHVENDDSDPAFRAWHRRVIRQLETATAAGDTRTAMYLWQIYDEPPLLPAASDGRPTSDPAKALTYLAAWAEQRRLRAGEKTVNAGLQREIDRRLAALPAPAREEAVAQGRRIAAMHAPSKAGTPMPSPAASR